MKRTVSLSEFMPYGAPDLLAASRPHLARALTVSSAMASLAFALAMTIGLHMPPPRVVRIPGQTQSHDIDEIKVIRDPVWQPPGRPTTARTGVVVPVSPATKASEWIAPAELRPDFPALTGLDSEAGAAPGAGTGSGPVVEVDPPPGTYTYFDVLPKEIVRIKPAYPDLAREAGVEGPVIIQALIGKDGHVKSAFVDPRFSIPLLNDAALAAAKQWVFTPAMANGHPVTVWYAITYHFVLNE